MKTIDLVRFGVLVFFTVISSENIHAQGTVNFNTKDSTANINAPVFDRSNGWPVKCEGTKYFAQLYGGPAGTMQSALIPLGSPINFRTGAAAGYLAGGSVTVPGVDYGQTATIQVRAWAAACGATYEAAIMNRCCGSVGSSFGLIITINPQTPGMPPPAPTALVGLQSFELGILCVYICILDQPQSQTVAAGADVILRVRAISTLSDSSLYYQWWSGDMPLRDATNATLTITNVQPKDTGNYYVIVKTPGMCGSWEYGERSSNAVLTVLTPPVITREPESQRIGLGGTATFVVEAQGSLPLDYQWRFKGANLPGKTNATLKITQVQASDFGEYLCVVKNSAGAANSRPARLDLMRPPKIEIANVELGQTITLRMIGDKDGVYRVEVSRDLQQWMEAFTVTNVTGTVELIRELPASVTHQFYRVLCLR